MRVAYLIWSLGGGGAERQLVSLVEGLDRAKVDPVVLLRRAEGDYDLRGVPTVDLQGRGGWTPALYARLVGALRRWRPEVLHTVMHPENLYGRLAARQVGGVRVVASVRTAHPFRSTVWSERALGWMVDRYLVNSSATRAMLAREARVDPARVDLVENGVDLARFAEQPARERARVRAALGVGDGPWLLMPARISPEKRQQEVVEAFAALAREGALPAGATLTLAGHEGLDRGYVRAVDRALADAGLGARAKRVGFARDVDAWIAAADAVLVPSVFEGMSNVVVESLCAGTPVVVTEGADGDALVREGHNGWNAGDGSSEALQRALGRVLTATVEQRAALGRNAREEARGRFAIERMVRETVAVYERALQGSRERTTTE